MISAARIVALAAFAVITAIALFSVVDRSRAGVLGVTLNSDATSNTRFIVTAAERGSGLITGDRVRIDDIGAIAAYQYHSLAAGSTLAVVRTSPLPEKIVYVPVKARATAWDVRIAAVAIQTMFLLIAILIALRGRAAGSLSLAWFFALLTLLVNPTTPSWPRWLILAMTIVSATIATLAFMCAIEFATCLAGDPSAPWTRRFRVIARTIGITASALTLGVAIASTVAPTTPAVLQYSAPIAFIGLIATLLWGLGLSYLRAPAADRQRVIWVAGSLALGALGFVLSVAAELAAIDAPARDIPLLLLLAMPLGCAYAILRYRLLDIAFVVNRATVFGVTSLLVLAALALVDFGLQALLGSWLVRTGLFIQLGLALVIGIATRPIHAWVDRVVDDMFFRRRHEAERALRRFARDVAYIDDPAVVMSRTVETVERRAELCCAIFFTDHDGALTPAAPANALAVDRNDEAVVRILAVRDIVDLRDMRTLFSGDYAFPMFARNRLFGLLVCGRKGDGIAAYAPDELEAIATVAHAAGVALDLLRIEALERELTALRGPAEPMNVLRGAM